MPGGGGSSCRRLVTPRCLRSRVGCWRAGRGLAPPGLARTQGGQMDGGPWRGARTGLAWVPVCTGDGGCKLSIPLCPIKALAALGLRPPGLPGDGH